MLVMSGIKHWLVDVTRRMKEMSGQKVVFCHLELAAQAMWLRR